MLARCLPCPALHGHWAPQSRAKTPPGLRALNIDFQLWLLAEVISRLRVPSDQEAVAKVSRKSLEQIDALRRWRQESG